MTPGFVSMAECQAVVATLGCNGGGSEYNLDALFLASTPAPVGTIPWPADKFPYIIWVGDEHNQTLQGMMAADILAAEAQVAAQTTTCLLSGCQPPACTSPACEPGPPEVFAIETPTYEPSYAAILNNTVNVRQRFFDIVVNDPIVYGEYLEMIWTDVCGALGTCDTT